MIPIIKEVILTQIDKEFEKKLFDYTPQQMGVLKSQLRLSINNRLDREKCVLCGSKSGKANSHNIPASILKNISSNGYLSTGSSLMLDTKHFIFPLKTGINATQTFNIICDLCENTRFRTYENQAIETSVPYNDIQYNELELKILLYMLYHKKYIFQYYTITKENIEEKLSSITKSSFLSDHIRNINLTYLNTKFITINTDIYTCSKDILDLEKQIHNNRKSKNSYVSIVDTIINHKTGFAISQGILPTYSNTGLQVNRTTDSTFFDHNFGYLCIAVLPLNTENTRVCVFFNKTFEQTLGFLKREFSALTSIDDKLKKISDLILLYSDKLVIDESKEHLFKQIYVDYPELKKLDPTKIRDPKEYLSIVSRIKAVNIFTI